MLAKNGGGTKKEKSKDSLKMKHDRRMSQPTKDHTEIATVQAISPRTLVIDLIDNPNGSLVSERKLEQTKSMIPNGNSKSPRNRIKLQLTSNRDTTKIIDVDRSLGSARRHASCGPRLMSVVAAAIEDSNIVENTPNTRRSSEIKCIGNKCGPENSATDSNNNQIASTKTSPRKTSLETPRIATNRPRLKPLNALSKTIDANYRKDSRAAAGNTTQAPGNIKEYRKYLAQSHLSLNKLPSKLPVNDHYYNSHFFAVGLSLRAWRSKYSRVRNTGDVQTGAGSTRMTANM